MKSNKINFTFIILLISILVAGISCTQKKEKETEQETEDTFVSRDPMIEDIEYSFIHMDEYLH